MALEIHLQSFDGPLDLLLYLIQKNKVDIYDIPIFEITQQYLAYLREMENMNMDIASEFIVMAATLINIKARMLLPIEKTEEEEEEDPREALARRLAEYQRYKQAANSFKHLLPPVDRLVIIRKPEPIRGERPIPPPEELLKDVTLKQLYDLCRKAVISKEDSVDPIRSSFKAVEREIYTVEEKIDMLSDMLSLLEEVRFYNLKERSHSKEEAITYFQAMLELSRMNLVTLSQEKDFGDIIMRNKREEEVHDEQ